MTGIQTLIKQYPSSSYQIHENNKEWNFTQDIQKAIFSLQQAR